MSSLTDDVLLISMDTPRTTTFAVLFTPPQVAVRVFAPIVSHLVVNVGPVPVPGVPPGALQSTSSMPVPFAVNFLGWPMKSVTVFGLILVRLHGTVLAVQSTPNERTSTT